MNAGADLGLCLFKGREGAGDLGHAWREVAVDAAEDRVLLVDHRWRLGRQRGQQGRQRGIAPEADHDVGLIAPKGVLRLHAPAEDLERRARHADGIAGFECRRGQRNASLRREVRGVTRAAIVCRQGDTPAAGRQGLGEGLGRKQVSAGAAGGDHTEFAQLNAPARAMPSPWA